MESMGIECAFQMDFFGKFTFFLIFPLIFVCVLLVYLGAAALYFKLKNFPVKSNLMEFKDFLINASLAFLAIIHIPVSESALTYYTCVSNGIITFLINRRALLPAIPSRCDMLYPCIQRCKRNGPGNYSNIQLWNTPSLPWDHVF